MKKSRREGRGEERERGQKEGEERKEGLSSVSWEKESDFDAQPFGLCTKVSGIRVVVKIRQRKQLWF